MGYIKHNTIIVTSWDEKRIFAAADSANEIGLQVIGPSDEVVNGYRSLMICPDGSKEGWCESTRGDERREQYKKWLNEQQYDDGSNALEWVEVAYGSDDEAAEVVAHAWVIS